MRIPMRGTVRRAMQYARRAADLSPQTLADTVAQTSKRRWKTINEGVIVNDYGTETEME